MAWVHPEPRVCPSCGYSGRTLITQDGEDGYHLSCGWCAHLSGLMNARDAFFNAWEGYRVSRVVEFECAGVPHWWRGRFVESIPIRVTLREGVATVSEVF